MGRKVFISFLGASKYDLCDYQKDSVSYGGYVRFIQESTLRYLISIDNWTEKDAAYFLLTEQSEAKNWNDNGHTNKDGHPIIQEGLQSILKRMKLPFPIIPVTKLPDGNSEKEIWIIFNRIFEIINEGDELYFDITHGYRYLPMLMLVLGSYSNFLKKTNIKSITYGNYEVSDCGKQPGLIMDLLPLNALQDWTYAAGQYLDSGNINQLKILNERVLKPILRDEKIRESGKILKGFIQSLTEVVDDWVFCRGININNSDHTIKLKSIANQLESSIIPPFNPLIDKIKDSLIHFDDTATLRNGFAAAEWCLQHGLYQQAATILFEHTETCICVEEGIDWKTEKTRNIVNIAFNIEINHIPQERWNIGLDTNASQRDIDERVCAIKTILKNEHFCEVKKTYSQLQQLRNDYNHSGMRNNPQSPKKIQERVWSYFNQIRTILQPSTTLALNTIADNNILINLSNHPSDQWSTEQKTASKPYQEILDIPFPSIPEDADEEYISDLADEYCAKIQELTKDNTATVHIMGEMTLTVALIQRLKSLGIECIASTSKRVVKETEPGHKEVVFQFSRFRRYE